MEKHKYLNLLKVIMESHYPEGAESHPNSIYTELENNSLDLPPEVHEKVKRLHNLGIIAKMENYTGQHENSQHYKELNPTEEEAELAVYPEKIYERIHGLLSQHLDPNHPALTKIEAERKIAKSANSAWHRAPEYGPGGHY